MSRIRILDQQTANSIAAGEVVERPASVVKELIENALDAGASVITAEIRQGGISLIRVTDNGSGMDREDAYLAFGRHATSKISRIEDLDDLSTMGFRGEALASIAAVAKVRLETRTMDAAEGTWLQIAAGELLDSGRSGCPAGTTITVENLFYNVPARFKFLRKDSTEAGQVTDVIERLALARPDVSFRLLANLQEILHTPGNNDLLSTIYAVYGKQIATSCLPVDSTTPPLRISGLVGRPDSSRNSRAQQSLFVNGRLVRAKAMSAALDEAYQTLLMKGKYAFAVLYLDIPPQLVDVNVHPQKMEVRFWNDQEVFRAVYHAVRSVLSEGAGIAPAEENDEVQTGEKELDADRETPAIKPNEIIYTTEPVEKTDRQQALQVAEQPALEFMNTATVLPESAPGAPQSGQTLLKINDLVNSRLIGQLFQTYILLELDQDLLLVDQHAAHEKIIFETLASQSRLARENNQAIPVQTLLVPLIIEVSKREMQLLQSEQPVFQAIGFEYDFFGPATVALRSLPDTGRRQMMPEPAFRLALDTLMSDSLVSGDKINDLYYSMACKAAVKAHDRLMPEEIDQLLADLQRLENPYQCPHGRPVIIRMPRHELEKRFKRIV